MKDEASQSASSLSKKIGTGLKTAAGVGAAAITALATTVVAVGTSFIKSASEVAAYGDNIDKMSQKLGLSAEAYQKWDFVLSQSGADIDSMAVGLKTLTNQIDNARNGSEDATAKFEQLGISMEQLSTMSREDIFEATIKGFQGMADSTERAALANDLFGRSGQELTPLFNATIEQTEELIAATEEYGMLMSNDAVKASAAFQDSLDVLQRALRGTKNNLMSEFLPSMTAVMDGLSLIFIGDNSGIEQITKGVNGFTANLTKTLPTVLKVASGIAEGLVSAISENLPLLLETGIEVVFSLAEGIIEEAPNLIDTAVEIIEQLIVGLSENAYKLGESAVNLLTLLVNALTENMDSLLGGALSIITGLVQGIAEHSPKLIDAIVALIPKLVEALTSPDSLNQIITSGLALVGALVEGLLEAIPQLLSAALDLVLGLVDYLLNPENTTTIKNAAGDLVTKIGEGLVAFVNNISDYVTEFCDEIKEKFSDVDWTSVGEGIVNKIKTAVSDAWHTLTDWVSTKLTNLVLSIKNSISNAFSSEESGIEDVGAAAPSAYQSAQNVAQQLTDIQASTSALASHVSSNIMPYDVGASMTGSVTVIQNIYAQEMTAAELMQEAKYRAQQAVIFGV